MPIRSGKLPAIESETLAGDLDILQALFVRARANERLAHHLLARTGKDRFSDLPLEHQHTLPLKRFDQLRICQINRYVSHLRDALSALQKINDLTERENTRLSLSMKEAV